MDTQRTPEENQDLKLVAGYLNSDGTMKSVVGDKDACGDVLTPDKFENSIKGLAENNPDHLLNHDPSQVLRPPFTEEEIQKGIDNHIKLIDQQVNEQPAPVKKPLFVAIKEDPHLINKLNDFLRIHSKENEAYEVLVIGQDITEKLYESYWFGKLEEEEQKIRIQQQQDEDWKTGAANLADSVFQVLQTSGYEKHDYKFNVKELKQEFAVVRKVKLTGTGIKQVLDTLLVFGYIVQTNTETAFNKLQFKLVHTKELKLKQIEKEILLVQANIDLKQAQLVELLKEKEVLENEPTVEPDNNAEQH